MSSQSYRSPFTSIRACKLGTISEDEVVEATTFESKESECRFVQGALERLERR